MKASVGRQQTTLSVHNFGTCRWQLPAAEASQISSHEEVSSWHRTPSNRWVPKLENRAGEAKARKPFHERRVPWRQQYADARCRAAEKHL